MRPTSRLMSAPELSRMALKSMVHGHGERDPYQPYIYSISTVPEELRKWNEDAYMPKKITIGPLHMGTIGGPEQRLLQDYKLECLDFLIQQRSNRDGSVDKCHNAIGNLDAAVRQSYVEEIKLDKEELATFMLIDGCLLLALLMNTRSVMEGYTRTWDPCFALFEKVDKEVLLSDLILLENQIPLFIVLELCNMLFPEVKGIVKDLAPTLFGYPSSVSLNLTDHHSPPVHFLELAYLSIRDPNQKELEKNPERNDPKHEDLERNHVPNDTKELEGVELNRCATRLEAVGVKIECGSAAEHRDTFNFDICFRVRHGTLEIPPLYITKTTEARWRNFIAWEHHMNKTKRKKGGRGPITEGTSRCKCTWAALFFSALICCPSDVHLLKRRGVIVVEDGVHMSNLQIMKFFHSITMGVDRGIVVDYRCCKVLDDLNKYRRRSPINYATEIPIRMWHYWTGLPQQIIRDLHHFLRRGYNYAAAAITILSILQTIYAVLSYHHPKKNQ